MRNTLPRLASNDLLDGGVGFTPVQFRVNACLWLHLLPPSVPQLVSGAAASITLPFPCPVARGVADTFPLRVVTAVGIVAGASLLVISAVAGRAGDSPFPVTTLARFKLVRVLDMFAGHTDLLRPHSSETPLEAT